MTPRSWFRGSILAGGLLSLLACGGVSPAILPSTTSAALQVSAIGRVHGGQPSVSFSTIQLYAVGTTGDGSAPTPLLTPAVISDTNGNFTLLPFTCPSPTTLVYFTATGGNPGLTVGTNNPALAMVAVIGQCGSLATSTFTNIDEVTTVAAASALAPYISAPLNIGSGTSDAAALATAFQNAIVLADTTAGTSPGLGQSSTPSTTTYSVPASTVNTFANVLSNCVNSTGSTASNVPCGMLFAATGSPANTFIAAANVELNPATYNATTLFGLAPSSPAFLPVLNSPPTTFAIAPTPPTSTSTDGAISVSPSVASVGSTVVITSNAGNIFLPPFSISFGGVSGSGSFTSTKITATVPSGTPTGNITGVIALASTSYSFPITILSGGGINVSTSSIVFPSQLVATTSSATMFSITNSTASPVRINSVVASGGSASSFVVSPTACTGAPLAVGASCNVSVSFRPLATGSLASTVIVYVNGIAYTSTVAVSGTGS